MLTQNSRDVRIIVGAKVDTNSIRAAISATDQFQTRLRAAQTQTSVAAQTTQKELQGERTVLEQLSLAFADLDQRKGLSKIAEDAARGKISLQDMARQLHDVGATASEISSVASQIERIQSATPKGGGFASGFGTVRSLAGAAGMLAGNSPAGSAIAAAAGLSSELGILGVVGVGAALVLRQVSEETERITTATRARLSAEADLRRQLEDATRKEAIAARDEAKKALDRANVDLAAAQDARVTLNADAILGLFTRNLVGGGEMEGNTQEIAKQKIAVTAANTAIEFWNKAIDENATAVNDMTQAQLANAESAIRVDGMTREEREKQIAQNERDLATLTALAESGKNTGDTFNNLLAQIDTLQLETEGLQAVTDSYADQLEREASYKKSLTDSSDAINDSLQDLAAVQQDVADAAEKTAEAQGQLTEAQSEHRDKQQQIILDQYAKEGAAQAQRLSDEGKARAKAQADLEKQEGQHQRRIAEINQDFQRNYQTAVFERNALSAFKARQALDDQTRKENANNDERKQAITDTLDEQLTVAKERYDEQLRAAREASVKAIAAEQDRYNKQYRTLQDALNKALSAERVANDALEVQRRVNAFSVQYWNSVVANSYAALGNASAALANKVTQAASQILNGASGNALVGGGSGSSSAYGAQQVRERAAAEAAAYREYYRSRGMPIQGYAAGTPYVQRTGVYMLHEGERVTSAQQNRMFSRGGGLTINIPITGTQMRKRDIEHYVDGRLGEALDKAGYQ